MCPVYEKFSARCLRIHSSLKRSFVFSLRIRQWQAWLHRNLLLQFLIVSDATKCSSSGSMLLDNSKWSTLTDPIERRTAKDPGAIKCSRRQVAVVNQRRRNVVITNDSVENCFRVHVDSANWKKTLHTCQRKLVITFGKLYSHHCFNASYLVSNA